MSNPQVFSLSPFGFGSPLLPPPQAPPRVMAAMSFLQDLTFKTMDRAVPHNMGCETIPGAKLVGAEVQAHSAACAMLTAYFKGKLPLDDFEKRHHQTEQVDSEKVDIPPGTYGQAKLIMCRCRETSIHPPKQSCPVCEGNGVLVAFAYRGEIPT